MRTLRDLGADLTTIRWVVDRELTLPEVARAHADALTAQIRTLRLRRAMLTAVAERNPTPEEMDLTHQLAKLSKQERRRLIDDFLDASFGGLGADPGFAAITRSMTPSCPTTPTRNRSRHGWSWRNSPRTRVSAPVCGGWPRTTRPGGSAACRGRIATSSPSSATRPAPPWMPASNRRPGADVVIAVLTAHYAGIVDRPDDEARFRPLTRPRTANDRRRERYFDLLAVINGWSVPEGPTPILDWSIQALEVRTR